MLEPDKEQGEYGFALFFMVEYLMMLTCGKRGKDGQDWNMR